MTELADQVLAARKAPALFDLRSGDFARGLVAVTGRDAPRWLDGMVTNDISAIASDSPRNGCYAALLTTKGRIVADLHVLARDDGYWLETAAFAIQDVIARLEKYIVADDVELADRSADFARLAVEGPGTTALLAGLSGGSLDETPPDAWVEVSIAGVELSLARFGWSGEDGWQLFAPADAGDAVLGALVDSGAALLTSGALEVLRVEAGLPRLGLELDEEVFPDEARLEAAISRTKGCYTGQEIVARLYSRGAVNHLLVGLQFAGADAPARGAMLHADDKRTGEVTSACVSPTAAAIGLGFVRREHAEPGTVLRCVSAGRESGEKSGELTATVAELPHVGGHET